MKPLLTVEQLTVRRRPASKGGEPVVRGVGFQIAAGETVALVGESGSGKTTTVLALAELLPAGAEVAAEARIEVDGAALMGDASGPRPSRLGGVMGMVFQDPGSALNPVRRVGSQLREVLEMHHNLDRADAEAESIRRLEEVSLPGARDVARSFPHQLSGGMQQRVLLALALAGDPWLLLADEPTSALDAPVQAEILGLIRELTRARGLGTLLVTHDLGLVAHACDRVLVMYEGEIVEEGAAEDVLRSPRHSHTRALVAGLPPAVAVPPPTANNADQDAGDAAGANGDSAQTAERAEAAGFLAGGSGLEVQGLSVVFPARRGAPAVDAVRDVSFRLEPGRTMGVVGASGSGKTSLARALLGLIPARGRVVWEGEDVLGAPSARMRRYRQDVQLVFQGAGRSLNPRMQVGAAVAEALEHGGPGRVDVPRRTGELLERVGLTAGMGRRYPHQLSGGQQQRVVLARSLALDPKVLVLDEPTSALDVSIQSQIVALLMRLQDEMALAYLLISHDLALVRSMSDHLLVMLDGAVIEAGTPDVVVGTPRHPYTRTLVVSAALPPSPDR